MRSIQRVRDLSRDGQGIARGYRPAAQPIGQRLAVDELQHERWHAAGLFEPVDGADVRMIERREHARFAVEPRHPLAVRREHGWYYLDRAFTPKLRVVLAIDLAHPARADESRDQVWANAPPHEALRREAVVALHRRRLQKARRLIAVRQQQLDFAA